jgi:hypothetical protein
MNVTVASGTTLILTPQETTSLTDDTGDNAYLFVNSSLTVQSGATLQCQLYVLSKGSIPAVCEGGGILAQTYPNYTNYAGQYGVTIVLTGSSVGTLTICGSATTATCQGGTGATVEINAPSVSTFAPSNVAPGLLNGILFYRRGSAPGEGATQPGVSIADTTSSVLLGGGMYFPSSYVYYTGNTMPDTQSVYVPQCSVIVAGYLNLGFFSSGDSQPNPTQFESNQCPNTYGTPPLNVWAAQVVE